MGRGKVRRVKNVKRVDNVAIVESVAVSPKGSNVHDLQ
jgi:hypothetical protein